ncbi:MAG TPA: 50S ribosomal protein L10 [Saprospiraceae bacterium]|nr:50S ribosomal protein L10 [Saprospiraceae bacterium]
MKREDKAIIIEELKDKFEKSQYFYITDSSAMNVAQINALRRICFEKGIEVKVVKNTLAIKAMEQISEEKGYAALYNSLKGQSTLLFSDSGNLPAKVIKEFRKKGEKPSIKAAYIDSDVFVGDHQIDFLESLKTKEELVGEVILLLQSPIKNVLGSLQSGGNTIMGLLKALEERA